MYVFMFGWRWDALYFGHGDILKLEIKLLLAIIKNTSYKDRRGSIPRKRSLPVNIFYKLSYRIRLGNSYRLAFLGILSTAGISCAT